MVTNFPSNLQTSGEALVLDALQTAMRLRKEVVVLTLRHLDNLTKPADHSPLDWWLLCAAFTTSAPAERKKVLRIVVDKASSKQLSPSLLRAAVRGHGVTLSPHFGAHLEMATALLQKQTASSRDAGGALYALVFEEFTEIFERQELLGHLLSHVGSGSAAEIEAALSVLVSLATSDALAVHRFASFLTYILDYLATLSIGQVDIYIYRYI